MWGFAAAFLIGALVGIEREKKKSESEDLGIGGVRTFILFALSGAVAAWLARILDSGTANTQPLLGVSALTVAGYLAQARVKPRSLGLTTEIAAVTVYLLGGACVAGHVEIVSSSAGRRDPLDSEVFNVAARATAGVVVTIGRYEATIEALYSATLVAGNE